MRLAPLPLVTFEKYMLCDDAPLYPMTCHIRFWFDRSPARAPFEAAFLGALALHPLMSARLVHRSFGLRRAFAMEAATPESLPEVLDWSPESTDLSVVPQQSPDFRVRLLVRKAAPPGDLITASPDGNGVIVLVQFHHAICDGIGVFDFFEDLLRIYNREIAFARSDRAQSATLLPLPALPTRRPELLATRGRFHLSALDWWRRLPWDLARYRGFFRKQPSPLRVADVPEGAVNPGPSPLDAGIRQVWSAERTKALSNEAKAQGVTLNDLLVTRYFQALNTWQREWRGPGTPNIRQKPGPLRVSVPTSLRLAEDTSMPAANVVSMVFLDRTGAVLDDYPALLASVAAEMRRIKDQRLGLAMIRILSWFARLPGVLRLFFRLPICQTTSVLTNLGKPFAGSPLMGDDGLVRAGDIVLTGIDTMPPVRPLTTISLSVNGYAGKLSLTLRYDGRRMTRAAAQRCLDLIASTFLSAP